VLFPTHLVATLLFGRHVRLSTAWLLVGATLPDVVDKSLAALGVVDLFHTVGHSALLVVLAVPLAYASRAGLALAVGWGGHLALDAFHIVLNGRPSDALFLLWPVAVPPTPLAVPPVEFFWYYLWSPSFVVEIGIWLALLGSVLYGRKSAAA